MDRIRQKNYDHILTSHLHMHKKTSSCKGVYLENNVLQGRADTLNKTAQKLDKFVVSRMKKASSKPSEDFISRI